jgi:hypothetical protein
MGGKFDYNMRRIIVSHYLFIQKNMSRFTMNTICAMEWKKKKKSKIYFYFLKLLGWTQSGANIFSNVVK